LLREQFKLGAMRKKCNVGQSFADSVKRERGVTMTALAIN
jgi:hypothetical protein